MRSNPGRRAGHEVNGDGNGDGTSSYCRVENKAFGLVCHNDILIGHLYNLM